MDGKRYPSKDRISNDAIGQFGENLIKEQTASQALANINLLSVGLSALGVDPFSTSALSNIIEVAGNGFSIFKKNSGDYLLNTALGTAFGRTGEYVTGLSSYKSLTVGVQMRTALSTTSPLSESAAVGVNVAPGSVRTIISTWLSK